MKPTSLIVVIWLFSTYELMANTTWNGSTSTDWCDASNWSAGLPDDNDDVTIPSCTTCPIITTANCSGAALADNIFIQAGGTLTVEDDLTGAGNNIEIQGGSLLVNAGANISGFKDLKFTTTTMGTYNQTGGTVTMTDDFKIETDNNTVNISGGTFSLGKSFEIEGSENDIIITGGNISMLYIKFYRGPGIEGCGNETCSNATDGLRNNVEISGSTVLSITGIDLGSTDNPTPDENAITITPSVTYDAGSPTNPIDENSVFGPDALGGVVVIDGETLPIVLLHFELEALASTGVAIRWTTAQEINNDYFTIERSFDSYHFHSVASVQGAGNHSDERHYSHTDYPQSSSKVIYYRLVQTDYDGTSVTYPIYSVPNEDIQPKDITVFPTITSNGTTIRVVLPDSEIHHYALQLIDMSGRVSNNLNIEATYNTLRFNVPTDLETGNYILKGAIDGNSFTKRIILN